MGSLSYVETDQFVRSYEVRTPEERESFLREFSESYGISVENLEQIIAKEKE